MTFKLSNKLVPIISKSEFDDVASDFLKKYYPQALSEPMAVPIEDIAVQQMNLQIKRVHISEDLSILGQIFFNSGCAEVYLKDTDEFGYETVSKGTMFIDPDVAIERNGGCERNTIAHECVHWHIHRLYHDAQINAGGNITVALRCPVDAPIEQSKTKRTSEDWMERQANGIAPRILMPKAQFINRVNDHPSYSKIHNNIFHLELLVDDIATFFDVSKQSACIRLSELGLK